MHQAVSICTALLVLMVLGVVHSRPDVRVEIVEAKPGNARLSSDYEYEAHVTLSIEGKDGELVPSGWSTRLEDGGDGIPYVFQPAVGV